MKKMLLFLIGLILMSGCTNGAALDQIKIDIYKSMYTDILNATSFKTSSSYFLLTTSLSDLGDTTYRYDIIIDEAKVAMYDVSILAIQDDGSLVISENMMPSVGIFEDVTYYMIPYQVNKTAHYVQGFALNGVSVTLPIRLKILVKWKDALNREYSEFFNFSLTLPSTT